MEVKHRDVYSVAMARTDPQVNFRIPAELNERLKEAAAENGRTITAELVHRLDASFRRSVDDDRVVEVVEGLRERLDISQQHAEIARAGALTSGAMVADLLDRAWVGKEMPQDVARLRDASLEMARFYEKTASSSSDELMSRAVELFHRKEGRDDLAVAPPKKKRAR
jgi:predicted DNA-binding protein